MTPGEIMDVVKARHQQAMVAGWWAEKFAREKRLKGLQHYMDRPDSRKPAEEVRSDYHDLKSTLGR